MHLPEIAAACNSRHVYVLVSCVGIFAIYFDRDWRMSSAVLVHTNGFGFWFQLVIHCRTSFSSATTLLWTPRRINWW